MMTTHLTHSADETMHLAADLARTLRGGECIALRGELGAGKTCFVRGLAQGLGIHPGAVSSPTFVLMQEYESPHGTRPCTLIHIDAYRLRGSDELDSIGWDEWMDRRDVVVAIEWPQRVEAALPADRIDIAIEHREQDSRVIRIETRGAAGADAADASGGKKCPICGLDAAADSPEFPFCSQRCRMADLHRWMGGQYKMSRPATDPRDREEPQE